MRVSAGIQKAVRALTTLLLFVGFIFLANHIINNKLGLNSSVAVISSNSMWPSLRRGDVIFLRAPSKDALKKNRVIAFEHESALVIHRIVDIRGGTITTKGDANKRVDAPIKPRDVIGQPLTFKNRVVKIPYLGKLRLSI